MPKVLELELDQQHRWLSNSLILWLEPWCWLTPSKSSVLSSFEKLTWIIKQLRNENQMISSNLQTENTQTTINYLDKQARLASLQVITPWLKKVDPPMFDERELFTKDSEPLIPISLRQSKLVFKRWLVQFNIPPNCITIHLCIQYCRYVTVLGMSEVHEE